MKCASRVLLIALVVVGCKWQPDEKEDPHGVPKDVQEALDALPDATVLDFTDDGIPLYIVGDLGKVGAIQTDDPVAAEASIRPMLAPVLAAFRLVTTDLALHKMNVDADGNRHFRYQQRHNGLDVIGADLVVHVDVKGAIFAVNGTARGDISAELGRSPISQSAAVNAITNDGRFAGLSTSSVRQVYIETTDGQMHKAYEVVVQGVSGANPLRDKVYVDIDTASILADYPNIYFAENRKVYNLNHGTSLPGTLARSEGGAATSDTEVNGAYDGTGNTYEFYKNFWNRDSYNNAGATLISSVHYSTNYCNAYWDGSQMVYGDGDASQGCGPLARAQDVTAHELTHAVTENESGLNYSGESGGMNEGMSDIFGTTTEAFVAGGNTGTLTVTSGVFLIGEQVLSPYLRNMCDPAADGSSADFWTSSVGSLDVHYSSGVANLMFCLLSKGGTHPRGKSTVMVPGVGMDKAIRIIYKAQTDILTSTSNYANFRTAMQQAASNLGFDQATQDAVGCAWAAVGVGTAPTTCDSGGGGGGGGGDATLTNGTPVTGIGGTTGQQQFWKLDVPSGQTSLVFTISGGTGDADMYVQFANKPTLSNYQCRPYINGNGETCTITNPQAGTWWVMLNGYATFSGVTLRGTYSATGGGDPYLTNGVAVTGIAGATGSNQYWRITTPAAKQLTVHISGGTGDADLYTRFGSRPTTSTYLCRPYLNGTNETCTVSSTQAGDYYIMLRGYQTYSGVSLIASF